MRKPQIGSVLIGAVIGCSLMLAQSEASGEIRWINSVRQAQQKWSASRKPLLVYVTSESCFFCKKLDQATWMDPSVGDLVKERFVKLKVNGQRNHAIAQQLNVTAFPTVIVLSADGQVLGRRDGFVEPTEMSAFLQTVAPATTLH
ncbi:thiol:disulfide interchange protein precursor [Rosistilla oblonga]|uniref:Thiol:disulfide interchange protein n=1 Tax=Rosistilla oblonga TaxID=2527990 RepID=A0A518IWK9_9BACT|nr:thioredoxin family protein [Rosistilla oblonga]QDV14398.1 thiol:disulfide interchange protein precursor [Rosistilla oblonga]QDV57463.1 thiol:disulfide interchange protein precursor [Rosistilla oblonga]